MKELRETVALMTSADYKERFAAEYYQLETRYLKLLAMCEKWDKGELNFTPTCDRNVYELQLLAMKHYLIVLIHRANTENVPIEINELVKPLPTQEDVILTKLLRRDIDSIISKVRMLGDYKETNLSITKLQEAVMWLGMNLKRIGEANSYPNSKDASNTIIDKTADGLKF